MFVIKTGGTTFFSRWLRTMMKIKNRDIYDLSVVSGVSDRTLADYLRGARMPKLENLLRICQAFGKELVILDKG